MSIPCYLAVIVATATTTLVRQPAASAQPAAPAPMWTDTPALLAHATAAVADDLRACVRGRLPRKVSVVAMRARDGSTSVAMRMPPVGYRGLTAEQICVSKAINKIVLPPLPSGVERVSMQHVITAEGATAPAVDPAFASWRDPAATLATFFDDSRKAALAACDPKPRTVRLILDLRKGATRVWMPAWQFHSPRGDGTTPPSERRIKACLTRAMRGWSPPLLPQTMAALEITIQQKTP